jgi:endonuclease G, mitochondrial
VFWRETNLLSNITPQKSKLNQGPWEKLERAERYAAFHLRAIWTVTGPLYERALPPLPQADEPHHIPSGYWKVITTRDGKVSAFLFDQDAPEDADYCNARISFREVERRTRLKLFPQAATSWGTQNLDADLGCEAPLAPAPRMMTLVGQ